MVDRGTDLASSVLEDEGIPDVSARPERGRSLRPQLDHPGGAGLAHGGEGRAVLRAVQDYLMAPVGQGGPAIGDAPDVVRAGSLPPARAERALAGREVGPVLAPR